MNRQERRRALKQMGVFKKMNSLSFLNPERSEFRKLNRVEGERKHRAMLEEAEKERYERLEHGAAEYEAKLKEKGYSKEVIEMLLEIKALQEVKVKETYREDKKRIKHLKKEVDRLLSNND